MEKQKNTKYVLSNDFFLLSRYFVPAGIIVLVLFSLGCLKAVFIDKKSLIPNLAAAVTFLLIGILLIISNHRIMPIVNLSFSYSSNLIINKYGREMNCVNINQTLFISEVSVGFAVRGSKMVERFLILSNQPFIEAIDLEQNGIYILKKLARNQVVILPSCEDTYKLITSRVGNINIPQYPKVAYKLYSRGNRP